jgi:hypothetical protein
MISGSTGGPGGPGACRKLTAFKQCHGFQLESEMLSGNARATPCRQLEAGRIFLALETGTTHMFCSLNPSRWHGRCPKDNEKHLRKHSQFRDVVLSTHFFSPNIYENFGFRSFSNFLSCC